MNALEGYKYIQTLNQSNEVLTAVNFFIIIYIDINMIYVISHGR